MQTIIHAICRQGSSLRDAIAKDDDRLADFGLRVEMVKNLRRRHGWAKLKSTRGHAGAINVTWDANSQVLKCRVVTRGGDPGPIVGDLLDYLLRHHARRIRSLTVVPKAGA